MDIEKKITDSQNENDKPKRSIFQMSRIGMVYFAIELLFSVEVALVFPILLKLKVSEKLYSYVYILCAFMAFFLQPALGYFSDKCTSSLGRRKPFILVLGITSFIGVTFLLNGDIINQLLGFSMNKPIFGQVLVFIGVSLLDFSADSSDSPLRALILDVCNVDDQDSALNIHAFLGGLGASLGFLLTSINWIPNQYESISDNQIIYFICSIVFLFSLFLTMTSVKEEVYKKDEDVEKNREGLFEFYKSFLDMPKELLRLLIYQFFGWMALFSTELFFTDFVAFSIYNGKATAPKNSTELSNFNLGTRNGSWGLLTFSLACSISALIFEKFLLKRFSTKILYSGTYIIYIVCCISIYFLSNIYIITPLCASFGILMSTLTTLPYQMISEFHLDPIYIKKTKIGLKRGYGVDCALLCSAYFLAQAAISSVMSFLTFYFGYRVIFIVASIFSFSSLLLTQLYVIFPEKNASNRT